VGYQGQWGQYTDVETRDASAGTYLSLSGGTGPGYDGLTGQFLTRAGGLNEYAASLNPRSGGSAEGILDGVQLAADAVGLVPLLNVPSAMLSGGISAARGDWSGVALSAVALVPVAGDIADIARLGKDAEEIARVGKAVHEAEVAERISIETDSGVEEAHAYSIGQSSGGLVHNPLDCPRLSVATRLPDRVTNALPEGEIRTSVETAQTRNFFERNREAARQWWSDRTGQHWPANSTHDEHPRPIT
jgi:hypothetical protein